jgi:spore coat polysaccharide biosynthesis predicted glycosyltransferase SpsG
MKIFYYAHTGHRIGLDRFKRASAIIKALSKEGIDVTLLTSDYRIASVSKDYGIKKCVGVDVVRNIANIANQGDKIIFDSEEANPLMLEDMRNYFSTFIRISDNANDKKANNEFLISPYLKGEGICSCIAVDEQYFQIAKKDIKLSYFFGDDDFVGAVRIK